jgi:hypothetical protein
LPVKLKPGKFYATWLNSDKFHNFKDANGEPAVPYLLSFQTAGNSPKPAPANASTPGLNDGQQKIVNWTDRQFRSFFDQRTFDGWSAKERSDLETRLLDTLKGPRTREYYQAINTLAALRSQKAVQPLLAIAADRAEKDCRDRWMAIRALGIIGDKSVVPELVHLIYHGNVNTRWWAQISLVRLTGVNFSNDWKGWGNWWNDQKGQPPFAPEFVRWYTAPELADPEKVEQTLAESDRKFFESLTSQSQ